MVPIERIINIYPSLISLTYSFFLIIISFFIFLKTKDIFDLSKNKSLGYFRLAFLFLGISNVILVLIIFIPSYLFLIINSKILGDLTLFLKIMTLIYLTYSMFYHKLEKVAESKYSPAIISLILVLAKSYIPGTRIIQIILSLILSLYFVFLFLASIIKYFNPDKKKKFHPIYLIYIILFLSMFMSNVLEIFAIVAPIISSCIYLLAIIAFIFLLVRVLKELVI